MQHPARSVPHCLSDIGIADVQLSDRRNVHTDNTKVVVDGQVSESLMPREQSEVIDTSAAKKLPKVSGVPCIGDHSRYIQTPSIVFMLMRLVLLLSFARMFADHDFKHEFMSMAVE